MSQISLDALTTIVAIIVVLLVRWPMSSVRAKGTMKPGMGDGRRALAIDMLAVFLGFLSGYIARAFALFAHNSAHGPAVSVRWDLIAVLTLAAWLGLLAKYKMSGPRGHRG